MIIKDAIWGEHDIKEEVLLELIESKPVQRLKGISQHGASTLTIKDNNITRFEHSIGVFLLLRKLGAPLKEQIAGLLHDVPHTAFSHVTDYVFDNLEFSYHDQVFEKIVMESEIPRILEKYGISVDEVLKDNGHGLLERELPELCADRVDYALRDGNQIVEGLDFAKFAKHFINYEGRIVMDDPEIALEFAKEYMRLTKEYWASPRESAAYNIMAQAMKRELEVGCITEEDLFMRDRELLEKMRLCADEESQRLLGVLTEDFAVEICKPGEEEYHTHVKCRYVDPDVIIDGELKKVSELSLKLLDEIKSLKEWCEPGHYVKVTQKTKHL